MTRQEIGRIAEWHRTRAEAGMGQIHADTAAALDCLLRQVDQMRESAERVVGRLRRTGGL